MVAELTKNMIDKDKVRIYLRAFKQERKIELWAKDRYEEISLGDQDFADMVEGIMEGSVDETDE